MKVSKVSPDQLISSGNEPLSADPLKSGTSPGVENLKEKKKNHIILLLIYYAFIAVQLAQGGMALSTVIIALKAGKEAISSKSGGTYEVCECSFQNKVGYYMPEVSSNISKVNGTYIIPSITAIDDSRLKFCLIYSDPVLVDQTYQKLQDTTQVFYITIIEIILTVLDIIDAIKPILYKMKDVIAKILKLKTNKKKGPGLLKKIFYKALVLGVVSSPRYLVLNFAGEDYSDCIGFNDKNPFYVLDHAFFQDIRPNTMNTWQNNSQIIIFKVYQIYLAFLLIFLVGLANFFIHNDKAKLWKKIMKYVFVFLFYVGSLGLILFGWLYLIINWMLIAAQMKDHVAVDLSIIYLSRDIVNVFTVCIIGIIDGIINSLSNITDMVGDIGDIGFTKISVNPDKIELGKFEEPDGLKLKFDPKMMAINQIKGAFDNPQDLLNKVEGKLSEEMKKMEDKVNQDPNVRGPSPVQETLVQNIFNQAKDKINDMVKDQAKEFATEQGKEVFNQIQNNEKNDNH